MEKTGKEKLPEMASTIRAGIIGFGLGALLVNYLSPYFRSQRYDFESRRWI